MGLHMKLCSSFIIHLGLIIKLIDISVLGMIFKIIKSPFAVVLLNLQTL